MTEHTKRRLMIDEDFRTIWAGDREVPIAEVWDTAEGLEGDCPTADANARRLVACWNFCERATTEELERHRLATTEDHIGVVPHLYIESLESPVVSY